MIEARGLTKSFGTVQAVQDISFIARDGCITGLLGPNGAGKSTTLRILYTILQPDSGAAFIDGIDARDDAIGARARMGVLPHNAGVYPNLTVRENIRYFGALQGMRRDLCARRADELIAMLELGEVADRRTKGFSQGQRLKTALARALVHAPRNVLLDEPTNGLDVMSVRNLRALLKRLRDAGHCVLFSSHVMQEVAAVCDEVVVIARGRVVASGTPEALRELTGEPDLESAFVRLTGEDTRIDGAA
jgi:sodium transport system ATP-binding protein